MKTPPEFMVGDKLWCVPSDPRYRENHCREVTITKVGRKWADLDNGMRGRMDIKSMEVDGQGYISPAKCWKSKSEWETRVALNSAFWAFQKKIEYKNTPPGVSIADILKAAELIGFPMTAEEIKPNIRMG